MMLIQTVLSLSLTMSSVQPTALDSAVGETVRLQARESLVLSAHGPSDEESAVSLGVAFLGPMPALDVRYVLGVSENSAFEGVISTLGIVQRLRVGARYRVTSDLSKNALALRVNVLEMHDLNDPSRLAAGVGPGALFTFRQNSIHWTASVDLAWSFLDRGNHNSLASAVQIQPALGVEFPIDPNVHVLIEGCTLLTITEGETFVIPLLTAGIEW